MGENLIPEMNCADFFLNKELIEKNWKEIHFTFTSKNFSKKIVPKKIISILILLSLIAFHLPQTGHPS